MTELQTPKWANISDDVIDFSGVISMNLRLEHWHHLWGSCFLSPRLGACSSVPNSLTSLRSWGVEAKVSLNIPSSLNPPRCLLRTKPWRSFELQSGQISWMWWLTLVVSSQWTWGWTIGTICGDLVSLALDWGHVSVYSIVSHHLGVEESRLKSV